MRHATKNNSLFFRELISKQEITKDLVMLLLQKEGIVPGGLFKAKIDFSGIADGPNKDASLVKFEKRNCYRPVFIHKGDVGMFVDVDCEAITSGSTLVSVKFLINEKVVKVAYDLLEDEPKKISAFSDVNVNDWLIFWRRIKI